MFSRSWWRSTPRRQPGPIDLAIYSPTKGEESRPRVPKLERLLCLRFRRIQFPPFFLLFSRSVVTNPKKILGNSISCCVSMEQRMARNPSPTWMAVPFGLLFLVHGMHGFFLPNATHWENILSKYRDEQQPHSRTRRAISRSDKEEILLLHNKLRGQVYPSASNMEYMVSLVYRGRFGWDSFSAGLSVGLYTGMHICVCTFHIPPLNF